MKSFKAGPLQKYESEQAAQIDDSVDRAHAEVNKPKKSRKKSAAKADEQKTAEATQQLEKQLKTKLEVELRAQIEAELAAKLETELRPKLTAELKPSIELAIKKQIETELKAQLEAEQKSQHMANKKSEIKEEIAAELEQPIECNMETKQVVEAILFAADKPMTAKQVQNVYPELERPDLKQIQTAINAIREDYALRPIGLKQLAGGYRFQVKEGYSYWVSRLFEEKPAKYSRALLETIAIIAYRQPVTRGDIEDIRGVSVSSNIIRTLLEREWVRIIAHKEVPGRPALYGTNKQFLDYFNLSSLDELPTLEEIKDLNLSADTLLDSEDSDSRIIADKEGAIAQTDSEHIDEQRIIEKQFIEEKASEEQTIIEPISETRH